MLPFLDTIVALTLVASEIRTLRAASGIIELPLRHPVTLAKRLASVDQVSKGRLIVGVGAGYPDAEFAAMGVPSSPSSCSGSEIERLAYLVTATP